MSMENKHKSLLEKLKKQIHLLQKKEERSRNQLQVAFKKIRHLGKVYKSRLEHKMRLMKRKVAAAEASSLVKVAKLAERVAKNVERATKVKKSHHKVTPVKKKK